MAVVRVVKNDNYTVMSNEHLRNKGMSLKAKGLLSLMLSKPDNWNYSLKGLEAICKEKYTSLRGALDELKQFGYLEVYKRRVPGTNNGYDYEYIIYETSQLKSKQSFENQSFENQSSDFQSYNKY